MTIRTIVIRTDYKLYCFKYIALSLTNIVYNQRCDLNFYTDYCIYYRSLQNSYILAIIDKEKAEADSKRNSGTRIRFLRAASLSRPQPTPPESGPPPSLLCLLSLQHYYCK